MSETEIIGPEESKRFLRSDEDMPNGQVQLGEYIIETRIGEGGMGQVYRAKQPSLDRMVALKVLPRSVANDKDAVERLYREAKSAARLVHPNIVQIYTVGEEKGIPYFAMEYIVGEDLDKRTRKGQSFSVEEAVGIAASVAMALACAGEHDIVHRDIKPANIMIDSHGVVKVTDFGLAKVAKVLDQGITQAGFIVGTPSYMAPEQAEGRDVDGRTDIYSLGVVFYELLVGKAPFHSDDPASLIYMHVHKQPQPPKELRPDIPTEVDRICLRCLEKDPSNRYQDAKELLTDLLHAKEVVSQADEGGTIIFDKNMASMLISPSLKPGAPGGKPREKPTEPTLSMQPKPVGPASWMAAHWPVVAGVAGAIITLLAVLLILLLPAGKGNVSGIAAGDDASVGGEDGDDATALDGALYSGTPVLPLSRLRGMLPEKTEVEVQIGAGAPYKVRALEDQNVGEGTVRVTTRKNHYKEASVGFVVGPKGCVPALSAELFRMEPDDVLAGLIDKARNGIEGEDFVSVTQAIEGIKLADPDCDALEDLEQQLGEAKVAWNQRWTEAFQKARGLMDESNYDEADVLLANVPVQHEHYENAKKLRTQIVEVKSKIREGRIRIDAKIREGGFIEARASYDTLIAVYRVPREELTEIADRLQEAERLEKEAVDAEAAGNYTVAMAQYRKLKRIAPASSTYPDKIASLSETITRSELAQEKMGEIEDNIGELEFEAARQGLADLRTIDGEHTAIPLIEERIERLSAKHEVEQILSFIDASVTSLDRGTLSTLIDRESGAFREACNSAMAALIGSGVSFTKSKHKLTEFDVQDAGAVAEVKWEYEIDVAEAKRQIAGSQDLRFKFRRRAEGLRLSGVAPAGKSTAALDGAGATDDSRIQGRITAVDGNIVTIDRGTSHGVRQKMVFTIYTDSKVIKMPLVDAVIVVEEERVGRVRVVEAKHTESIASLLGSTELNRTMAVGALAVMSPLAATSGSTPAMLSIRTDRSAAHMGNPVTVQIDVRNVDNVPAYYSWTTSGGRLAPARTSLPKTTWYAPAAAGVHSIEVTCHSPYGETTRKASVRGLGAAQPPESLALQTTIKIGAPFYDAVDMAFDEDATAYVLDGKSGRLHILSSEFEPRSVSSQFKGRGIRIMSARRHIYVLSSAGEIQRFSLNKDPFASPAGTTYGSSGIGNGKLRRPVAFTLSPAGDVSVIDAGTFTVQQFGPDGRFLTSFGTQGKGVGGFAEPVAITADTAGALYVLDSMRRQVLTFRNGRFDGEFSVGEQDGELVDLSYDNIADVLLVLDTKRLEVLAYTTGGRKLKSPIAATIRTGNASSSSNAEVGSLTGPSRIISDGIGRFYVIDGERTQIIRRFDLPGADAKAVFTGELETVVPLTFSKAAASPDATLYLLDVSGGNLWHTTTGGWRTLALGGKGSKSAWSNASSVTCDGNGAFYVLDSSLSTVHRFSSEGKRIGRFGKKGRSDDPHNIPGATDIFASPVSASLAGRLTRGEDSGFVAVMLRDRTFGVHLFSLQGTPKSPFPAKADGQRACAQIAVTDNDNVLMVPQAGGYIEEFNRDGGLVRRREIPASDASGLAISPDGTAFVLDARRRVLVIVPPDGKPTKVEIPRTIRSPSDVTCDGYGTLYLLDGRSRSISVWQGSSRKASSSR